MKRLLQLRLVRDAKGQDLIEYALIAGFIAVAVGAAMPNFINSLSGIYSRVVTMLTGTAGS